MNLQFFPVQPSSLGLKGASSPFFVAPARSINKASMKDAVVLFNGGCTGELISSEGLLLTNHHCGYDAIQALSLIPI